LDSTLDCQTLNEAHQSTEGHKVSPIDFSCYVWEIRGDVYRARGVLVVVAGRPRLLRSTFTASLVLSFLAPMAFEHHKIDVLDCFFEQILQTGVAGCEPLLGDCAERRHGAPR